MLRITATSRRDTDGREPGVNRTLSSLDDSPKNAFLSRSLAASSVDTPSAVRVECGGFVESRSVRSALSTQEGQSWQNRPTSLPRLGAISSGPPGWPRASAPSSVRADPGVPRPRASSPSVRRTASRPSSMASIWWPPRRSSSRKKALKTPDFVVPGGGAKVVQALAAGQVLFALGDSNHPLKITEKGKDALMIFATDTRCSYANIVARKELFDRGLRSVEALADEQLVGRT